MAPALAYFEESAFVVRKSVDDKAADKNRKKVSPASLPNEALCCLFDHVSVGHGKRVLEFDSECKYFEENPAAWRLALAHPSLRSFYLNDSDVYPQLFDKSAISKLTLENVSEHGSLEFCSELENLLNGEVQSKDSSRLNTVPILQRVKELTISRPQSLSDFALTAIPVSFPNVSKFVFKDGYYGVLDFSSFLSSIFAAWKSTLKSLNLSGVHGVRCNLEWCIEEIGKLPLLEELDLSKWRRDYFAPSSLKFSNLAPLAFLRSLKCLHLRYCRVDEESLKTVLAEMSDLEEVNVMNSNVSPKIASMLPLSIIALHGGFQRMPHITGRDPTGHPEPVSYFSAKHLPRLQKLTWGCWSGERQGWKSLAPMAAHLTELEVWGQEYSQSGYETLEKMNELRYLSLQNGAVTYRCMKHVNRLEQLERLELDCVGSAGLLRTVKKIMNARALASRTLRTLVLKNVKQGPCLKEIEDFVLVIRRKYSFLAVVVHEKSDLQHDREENSEDENWV